MKTILRGLLGNKFLRDNTVLFVGTVFTGALNYALYPLMSRLVTVQEFGEVQIVLSIILQASVIGTVLSIFIVNVLKEEDDPKAAAQFIANASRTMLALGLFTALLFMLASPFIKSTLKFDSVWPFLPAAIAFVYSMQLRIPMAYMQARENFNAVSVIQMLQALSKLTLAVAAGVLGFGHMGILGGIAASSVLMLLLVNSRVDYGAGSTKADSVVPAIAWGALKAQLGYILLIGSTLGAVFMFMSLDTFFAKALLTPEDAGLYAGVAVVARTLFYLTASIAAVLISAVRVSRTPAQNVRTYSTSIAMLAAVVTPVLLVVWAFSDHIVRILVGAEYLAYSSLLFKLCLTMFLIGVINLIVSYHVALKEKLVVAPALVGLLVTVLLVASAANTPAGIANAFLLGVAICAGLSAAWSAVWNTSYFKHKPITPQESN